MLAQAIRRRLGKAAKEEKGFTLIELLAVIVILGIIAVIAIPMIGNLINNTKTKSDLSTARQVYDASRIYVTTELGTVGTATINVIGSGTTGNTVGLQSKGYLEPDIYLPSNKKEITGGVVNYVNGVLTDVAAAGNVPEYAISLTTSAGTVYFTKNQILTTEVSPTP